jgi:hypothetical protein
MEEEKEKEEEKEEDYKLSASASKDYSSGRTGTIRTSTKRNTRSSTKNKMRVLTKAGDGLWRGRDARAKQLMTKYRAWVSELRARDIQLMLRMSSIMPSAKMWLAVTQAQIEQVEAAKYILGKGGNVDENFFGIIARAVSGQPTGVPEAFGDETKEKESEVARKAASVGYVPGTTTTVVPKIPKSRVFPSLRQLTAVAEANKEYKRQKRERRGVYGRVMTFMGPGAAVLTGGSFVEVELDWKLASGKGAMLVTQIKNVQKLSITVCIAEVEKIEGDNLFRSADESMSKQRRKKKKEQTKLTNAMLSTVEEDLEF